MILLLNGSFGIGKTTVARGLVANIPGSVLFDPELIGIGLQRLANLGAKRVDDFQDLVAWRKLTVAGLRVARNRWGTIIVPMAISNPAYLSEIRDGISRFEPRVQHYCLTAPTETVHARLRSRGANPIRDAWQFRRAAECCEAHSGSAFAHQVDAANRKPEEIVRALLERVSSSRFAA